MIATLRVEGEEVSVDLSASFAISIDIDFAGAQPRAFGLSPASATPFKVEGFVGAVGLGGPVNCFEVRIWPHGNGTHTETVGHITSPPPPIAHTLTQALLPCTLLSVALGALGECEDHYEEGRPTDLVITAAAIDAACSLLTEELWPRALILRTLPNHPGKMRADYSGQNPAYLTQEAMARVRALGVQHLLVDVPSVDREEDQGVLRNHRTFWGVPPGATDAAACEDATRTITEMIFAPDTLPDARYMLSLQVPGFLLDAAPSRALLYPLLP